MTTETAYTSPRFVIVNAENRPADDLGGDPIFATEAAAEEAVESLEAIGWDMDDYMVRGLTTDDLAGYEREAMLAAVRDEAIETAEQEIEACGELAPWSSFVDMAPSWDALDAMLLSRFGVVRSRSDNGVTRAYRDARESVAD